MSGLAEILRTMKFDVSGSDLRGNDVTGHLEALGVTVYQGHRGSHVRGADVVVYSSAVKPDNPELVRARQLDIPVISRGEMLAELMRTKYCVTIAGSHGKTTTTSVMATVLRHAGLDPTVVVGGKVNALGTNAALGEGDLFVAEADESDGSFLRYTPTLAVVTNIDAEHLDHYGTHEAVKDAFVDFVSRIPFYGLGIFCLDHPHVQSILPRVQRRYVTYGFSHQADYRARHVVFDGQRTEFEVVRRGDSLGTFVLNMPGNHNVQNALAVVAAADELEVPFDVLREGLAEFRGVQRRFTIVAEPRLDAGSVIVVDDYGHHPAEIEATLDAAQSGYDERRIVVAFQPHRYSRTHHLFDEFTRAFNHADVLFVTEVYAAGEAPIEGANGLALADAIRAHGHHDVRYVADKHDLGSHLLETVRSGDLVITLGAGDVNAAGRALVDELLRQGVSS